MTSQTLLYIVIASLSWLLLLVIRQPRQRMFVLLGSSYLLYASWGLSFCGVLVTSSIVNYLLGTYLRQQPTTARLWGAVVLNIVLLGTFKYIPTIALLLPDTSLTGFLGRLILPVGMSFWTFQALSYLFDIYRGEETNPTLVEFLLYMSFWPTALSGPICRLSELLPQFRETPKPVRLNDVLSGSDRVFRGLVMTTLGQVLASGFHLGQGLDAAFDGTAHAWSALDVWCVAVGYGFALFFNFAGYSHIVIGAARIFGFNLAENFSTPFLANTPSDFWNRWHMSLSFWIRDYLFLPLAMLRREKSWRSASLILSMVVFGIWHKGSVLFFCWGLYQGILLVAHRQWQQLQRRFAWRFPERISGPLSWFATFATICLGFVLFRANTFTQASAMLKAAVTPDGYTWHFLSPALYLTVTVCGLGYFALVHAGRRYHTYFKNRALPMEIRLALYSAVFYIGFMHGAETQSFVYFQF